MSLLYASTLALLLFTALVAALAGGRWEKTAALVLLTAWGVTDLGGFDHVRVPVAAIIADAAVFLFCVYAALYSRLYWPYAAASLQFLVLATHWVFATNGGLDQWAYVTAYYVWTIGVIVSLVAGVASARRRRRLATGQDLP